MKPTDDFLSRMREAAQLLQTSGPLAATEAIQRALNGGGTDPDGTTNPAGEAARTAGASRQPGSAVPPQAGHDGMVDINPAPPPRAQEGDASGALMRRFRGLREALRRSAVDVVDLRTGDSGDRGEQGDGATGKAERAETTGQFIAGSFSGRTGSRAYKLYIPAGHVDGEPLPLVVMLHGCKQNPDDFAAGTGMNAVADELHFLVLYPAQAQKANGSNCWNWFQPSDQRRDRGEPAIIADLTRDIMGRHNVDPQRVYAAGLSAGGAMAAILGEAYPDLYAAVGIHSGLPAGSAHDVASAFAAMKNGGAARGAGAAGKQSIPAIVFHGDRDATVHPRNGEQALAQCRGGMSGAADAGKVEGKVPQGRAYTATQYRDGAGAVAAEHWLVHGAGHAWAGGSRRGSYTDPKGPDASREMLRFFLEHPKAAQ